MSGTGPVIVMGCIPPIGDLLQPEEVDSSDSTIIIAASVVISIFGGDRDRQVVIDPAAITLSVKIIYLIHWQMRVNHFEFRIACSLEWRLTEITMIVKKLDKD